MKPFNIAIDGPSGVGKSTVSDSLAELLKMRHLDTGAMYRCVALYLKKNETNIDDPHALEQALDNIAISFQGDDIFLNGTNVSDDIRTDDISMYASKTSALPAVRKKLVDLQQQITKEKGYIVDGRDICTVVLPDAEVKIYLEASAEARAQRRYKQNLEKGLDADYQTIYDEIVQRDYQDSHREISPLQVAEDAIVLDTSDLTKEETVQAAMEIINKNI